jgi:hypothetical protein
MGLFGGPGSRNKVRSADKRTAERDTRQIMTESKELRRQISRDMFQPGRVTARQISANLGRIDRQLTALEKLRGAVTSNHDKYAEISAEKARLKEQGRALKLAKKAERLGASPKDVAKSGGILSLLARRKR